MPLPHDPQLCQAGPASRVIISHHAKDQPAGHRGATGSRTAAWLVPDNLKTGVDKPGLYDPKVNRSYGELAAHYGCLIDPARSRKPRDKAQIERPMPYIRDSFWRGREFTSLEQMQAARSEER